MRSDRVCMPNRKHGHTWKGGCSPEYASHREAKRRVDDPKHPMWGRYGGREPIPVRMCVALRGFETFLAVMGPTGPDLHASLRSGKPRRLTLNRRDNDGHYSCGGCDECIAAGWPLNVEWATAIAQANNRSTPVRDPSTYDWARSRTTCVNGHAYIEGSFRQTAQGRKCRLCERDRERRRSRKRDGGSDEL